MRVVFGLLLYCLHGGSQNRPLISLQCMSP